MSNLLKSVSMTFVLQSTSIQIDLSEKAPQESIKTFQPHLKGFSMFHCFHHQFFIVVFRFGIILMGMETQLQLG